MGAYKYYNPSTDQWEIVKSKSIIKPDGSLEYTPDDIKDIDDKVDVLTSIGTTSGTANTYTVSINGVSQLYAGLKVTVKFHVANTGSTTLNINGLGAKSIIKAGGGNPNIKANGVYTLVYTGTVFQLLGEGGEYGTAQPSHVLSPYTIGTEEGLKTGTMPNRGSKTFTPSDSTQTGSSGYYSGITVNPRPALSGTAATSHVLSGKTFYGSSYSKQTGTMPNRGAVSKTITTQGGIYTIPAGYHSGSGKVKAQFANLVAGNIKDGVNIGGIVGTLQEKLLLKDVNINKTFQDNSKPSLSPGQGHVLTSTIATLPSNFNTYSLINKSPSQGNVMYIMSKCYDSSGNKKIRMDSSLQIGGKTIVSFSTNYDDRNYYLYINSLSIVRHGTTCYVNIYYKSPHTSNAYILQYEELTGITNTDLAVKFEISNPLSSQPGSLHSVGRYYNIGPATRVIETIT